jgi:hypothetical protein
MGLVWALSPLLGWAVLDVELMVRTHGALNAAGLATATLCLPERRTR